MERPSSDSSDASDLGLSTLPLCPIKRMLGLYGLISYFLFCFLGLFSRRISFIDKDTYAECKKCGSRSDDFILSKLTMLYIVFERGYRILQKLRTLCTYRTEYSNKLKPYPAEP